MNREIKFRAWDVKNKTMHSDLKLHYYKLGDYANFPSEYELMQYTGLRDKNDKEIYEGDIVVYKYLSGFDCEDKYEEAHLNNNKDSGEGKSYYTSPEVVEFKNGEFWPKEYYNDCDDEFYSYRVFDIEIIGNIYENPELIK